MNIIKYVYFIIYKYHQIIISMTFIHYDLHLKTYGKKARFDNDLYAMVETPFDNINMVYDILNVNCKNLKKHNINPKDIIHICYHDCKHREKACCAYYTFCINKICNYFT